MAIDTSKIVVSRPEWRESMIEVLERAPELTPDRLARLRSIVGADRVDVRPRSLVAA